jgi:hypothetical protein
MSRPDSTWIDGRRYFDRDDDLRLRATAATERAALLQKALAERQKALTRPGGGGDGPPAEPAAITAHTDDHDEFRSIYHNGGNTHTCSAQDGGHQ